MFLSALLLKTKTFYTVLSWSNALFSFLHEQAYENCRLQ